MRRTMSCLGLWFIACGGIPGTAHSASKAPDVGSVVTTPTLISRSGGETQPAERGLFFVSENRVHEDSRVIPIHFLRFRALDPPTQRPPVFLLPGGPGSEWSFADRALFDIVGRLRREHDVIYVSQRGNPRAPIPVPDLYLMEQPVPLNEPGSPEQDRQRLREALLAARRAWTDRGVDLSGYDILNIVDDVYELRAALGYDKIVLNACSFGSQWSLAYLKRWPKTVDRALLSGVEPLDYAYDDPEWLWKSMTRLADTAAADPHLAPYIPDGGLMEALRTVVRRLEEMPVTVDIVTPSGERREVALGAHDLRRMSRASFGESMRQRYENWPRFILELHGGDYRYLAALRWESEGRLARNTMIGLLIDNSLGISAARDARLVNAQTARWLGDINARYRATRDVTPTLPVPDDFRNDWTIDVPVLLVNGDLDWSTPIENAEHTLGFLSQGHLMTVVGAGHCPIESELAELRPDVVEQILAFVDADLADGDVFAALPAEVALPPFEFDLLVGPSLYDRWLAASRH